VRVTCTRARRRGDGGGQIHVNAQPSGLRHDVSDLLLRLLKKLRVGRRLSLDSKLSCTSCPVSLKRTSLSR